MGCNNGKNIYKIWTGGKQFNISEKCNNILCQVQKRGK